MRTIGRWLSAILDRADYLLTRARRSVLDWLSPLPDLAMLGRGDCEGSIILLSEKTGWVFASTACHRAKVLEGDDGSFRQGRHGFNDDGRNTGCLYVERVGSTWRQVDYASAREWAAIIDFDDDRTAVV